MNRLYKFVPFARKSRDLTSPTTKRAPSGFLVRIGVESEKPGLIAPPSCNRHTIGIENLVRFSPPPFLLAFDVSDKYMYIYIGIFLYFDITACMYRGKGALVGLLCEHYARMLISYKSNTYECNTYR